MTYMPTITNEIRPWFEQYGMTLQDLPSFRHMLAKAKADVEYSQILLKQFEEFGLEDEAKELALEIQGAIELMAEIEMTIHNLLLLKTGGVH